VSITGLLKNYSDLPVSQLRAELLQEDLTVKELIVLHQLEKVIEVAIVL
jgi:hypothetical protein